MQFLSPWTALLAAAVALPLLLLLYFLKLRRQTLRIPSTLLWRKSFEDLQVNAPFQRLRWSLLLLLQLLMLAALLAALSEPLWRGGSAAASRVVILLDRSASMSAPTLSPPVAGEPTPTRFDVAKREAREIIDQVGSRGGPTQIMLIAFGSTAQVVSTFESNRGVLRDLLDSVRPTDEQANLDAALELASAFVSSRDEDAAAVNADVPPEVVLLSDGNVGGSSDRGAFSLRAGTFRFEQVAGDADQRTAADNLGIAALGARRDYEDPSRLLLFARLVNAGERPLDPLVTVLVNGEPAATIRTTVPAANADRPGEATISHALDLADGAVIALRHNHADMLAVDDVAAIVAPPPDRPRIALVYPAGDKPNPYLREMLDATEPQRLDAMTGDQWSQLDAAEIDSGLRYDFVVFDRISGARLPGVGSVTFGGVPSGLRSRAPENDRGRAILSWDRQHPVMRNLTLDSIVYSGFGGLEFPESTVTPLAFGPDGPVIALVKTRGARHVVVGFALGKSNWPLHVSGAMFLQNALEYLTLGGEGAGLAHRPGETIAVRAAPQARTITLAGPGGSIDVPVESPGASVTLPAIRSAGVFSVKGAMPPNDVLAVSVLSELESDIRPRDSITVNSERSESIARKVDRPLPLWPWLLATALALAVLEWLAYCRRAW